MFVFVFFQSAAVALAQTEFIEQGAIAAGLPLTSPIVIIANIIRIFLGVLGFIFLGIVIHAGFLWMTSGGDATKTAKVKKKLKSAVIGLLIIFSSYTIVSFVLNALLGGTSSQIQVKAPLQTYHEPLSGSLGAGIIESHYPSRNATNVPRNTKIFITFKEPIEPSTIMNAQGELNSTNVWIFETANETSLRLSGDQVKVAVNDEKTTFVFDPVPLLGNPTSDTNYTIALKPEIKKLTGGNAFVGTHSAGYGWTFEVSTELDLIPPHVVSKVPEHHAQEPRNVTIELTFSEAMDPMSSTGFYKDGQDPKFTNITVSDSAHPFINGTFEISNGYRTVGFTTTDACSKDPCGDLIYCLPTSPAITVVAKAASVDKTNPPQAILSTGLTDASGNSLDGNGDKSACGSEADQVVCTDGALNDNHQWVFETTGEIEDTVPMVMVLTPPKNAQEIDQNEPVEVKFNTLLKSSSITSSSVSLWPDPLYSMWFTPLKEDNTTAKFSTLFIKHPAFLSNAEGGHNYYPVMTQGVKSSYQICMYPAKLNKSACDGSSASQPYCCSGVPSSVACRTEETKANGEKGLLPGNN